MKVKLGCDGCIRRKTMFCPPSIECMALDNLPYYLDKTSALEEIERLTISLQAQEELTMNEHIKVERLNNIIKEVREYIESYNLEYLHETNEHNLADILEELLEILDKENNNECNKRKSNK